METRMGRLQPHVLIFMGLQKKEIAIDNLSQ